MRLSRRKFARVAVGAALVPCMARQAAALDYPTRPVKMVIGFAPGGPADIVARLVGQSLSQQLGQPFVLENKPGAGTTIATETAAHSAPDGYTLLWTTSADEINATLYRHLNYNFMRDIEPVASVD
ncbi:MAG: Bug family tripartite tricarboxylate transporter substrate binding protein, partial [Xanthobacteraceae bacterium]